MTNISKNYPKVAIVGRTNVGKSTLFNRLASTEKSMVFAREGVTRDYIHEIITWNNKTFDLIDTGGLPLEKTDDAILQHVLQSVHSVIKNADLILFVCDGKVGLTEQDQRFAKLLHKTKKPVFVLLNKSDNTTAFSEHSYEFVALGFKQILPISALHGKGIRELLEAITENIAETSVILQDPEYKVVILGKPNVGKSSLLNLLLKRQSDIETRAIVSEQAGTTREAISETITFHKEAVQITDTAGVRKKGRVEDPLEQSMVKSSLYAVRQADIVLVVIDSTDGHLADQELKLLFYAHEQKKSIILLLNKGDILTEEQKDRLKYDMKRYEFFIKKIPVLWISCKTEKNIGLVFKEIKKARARRQQKFDPTKVCELIKEAFTRRPLYHKKQLLKILNVKSIQTKSGIPTFALYVNHPEWFGDAQLSFIENQLRRSYDLLGCPIKFVLHKV